MSGPGTSATFEADEHLQEAPRYAMGSPRTPLRGDFRQPLCRLFSVLISMLGANASAALSSSPLRLRLPVSTPPYRGRPFVGARRRWSNDQQCRASWERRRVAPRNGGSRGAFVLSRIGLIRFA